MITTGILLKGISGIYAIIHRETGAVYVGSSCNISARMNTHINQVRTGIKGRLYDAIRKYGEDAFDFEVLEECPRGNLLDRETFYIALLGGTSVWGLNVLAKAHAVYGATPNAATRARQSAAKRGKKLPLWHRQKLRGPRKKTGTFSEAHRRALSEAHKKSVACIRHRQNLHAKRLGSKQPPELIERRVAALRGRKRPPEVVKRISEANRGKKQSPEAREAMRAGWVAWRIRNNKPPLKPAPLSEATATNINT